MAENTFIDEALRILRYDDPRLRFKFHIADSIDTQGTSKKRPAIPFNTTESEIILNKEGYLNIKISLGGTIGYVQDMFIPSYYNTNLAAILKFRREKSTYHSNKFSSSLYLLNVKCLVGKKVETFVLSTLYEETRNTFIALYNLLKIKSRGLKYSDDSPEGKRIKEICEEYHTIPTEYKRSCNHYGLEIKKVEYIINKLCNILVDQEITNEKELADNRYDTANAVAEQLNEKIEKKNMLSIFTSKATREDNYAIGVAKKEVADALKYMADLEAETADKLKVLKNSEEGSNKKLKEYQEKLKEEENSVNRELNEKRMQAVMGIRNVTTQWDKKVKDGRATAGVGKKLTADFKYKIKQNRNIDIRITNIFGKNTEPMDRVMDKEMTEAFERSTIDYSAEYMYKFVNDVLTYIEKLVEKGKEPIQALNETKELFKGEKTPEDVLKSITEEMKDPAGGSSKSRKAKNRKSRKNKKSRSRTRKNRSFKKNNKNKNTKKRR